MSIFKNNKTLLSFTHSILVLVLCSLIFYVANILTEKFSFSGQSLIDSSLYSGVAIALLFIAYIISIFFLIPPRDKSSLSIKGYIKKVTASISILVLSLTGLLIVTAVASSAVANFSPQRTYEVIKTESYIGCYARPDTVGVNFGCANFPFSEIVETVVSSYLDGIVLLAFFPFLLIPPFILILCAIVYLMYYYKWYW